MADNLDISDDALKSLATLATVSMQSMSMRRAGTSNTVRPYYAVEYAIRVRDVLDALCKSRETQVLKCDPHTSYSTHKTRWSQGSKFLCDMMDPDGFYKDVLECVRLQHDLHGLAMLVSFKITPTRLALQSAPDFTPALRDFLEHGEVGNKFERSGLTLNDEQIATTTAMVKAFGDQFVSIITPSSVMVAKLKLDPMLGQAVVHERFSPTTSEGVG